ncbi:MAG: sialate O-acetylesterase, partial [Planctomyces sp.]
MKTTLCQLTLLWAVCSSAMQAGELRLAGVFSDHMVLQRQVPVRIWGQAAAGAAVQVSFAGQQVRCTADADGVWQAVLEPLSAESGGRELTVSSGDQQVTVQDVLVGEVWLLGGQSNMEMPLWWRG